MNKTVDWNEQLRNLRVWSFGDNAVHADQLAKLVVQEKKTGTTGLLQSYKARGLALPKAGDRSFIKNSVAEAVCVIEMTKVEMMPFDQVTQLFARTETWDDGSLESWKEVHREYFVRLFSTFTDDMPVIRMNFKLLHIF